MPATFLFLSDLHLGAGDALEDFLWWGDAPGGPVGDGARGAAIERLDRSLAEFLARHAAEADAAGLEPRLILLGDSFDLWQVQRRREKPARALERILVAHPGAVAGLRGWLGAGGQITVVVGNHDQPLVDPAAWGLLAEVLPGVNSAVGGGPVHFVSYGTAGFYAEHGHQWDPLNRLRSLRRPDADCPGRRFVRAVVNPLEPMLPLIDKGADFGDFLQQLWQAGSGDGVPLWQEVAGHLIRLAGRGAGPAGLLAEELGRWLATRVLPDFGRVVASQLVLGDRAVKRVVARTPGAAIGAPPANFRFLLSGHTHRPFATHRGDVLHLNPGTWRPLLDHDSAGRPYIHQNLTAAVVRPEGTGWVGEVVEGRGQ